MELKPTQKRYLRGQAHHVRAVLQSGAKGITEAFLAEVGVALDQHELIKLKLAAEDRPARAAMVAQVADATGASVVQTIGHTVVLFRRNRDEPKIALPG
ncbi:MAG: ribosome assembly RNA-binding protein YhbY [Xanthomonadales bacterium]|nr:ribosome assembly RNA-binding protein YhbY [Xanthomonadales bacterium]